MKKIILITLAMMTIEGSMFCFSGVFGYYGSLNASRDGDIKNTLGFSRKRYSLSTEKMNSMVSSVKEHWGKLLNDGSHNQTYRVFDPVDYMKKHLTPVVTATVESDAAKKEAAEKFNKLVAKQSVQEAAKESAKKVAKDWSSVIDSSEAIAKRTARAIAKSDGTLGVAVGSMQPSESLLRSFVAKLPSLEKLAAQEAADGFKHASRAYDMLWKYYEPAKQAGLIPDKTIKGSVYQNLFLGTGVLTSVLYVVAKVGEKSMRTQPVLSVENSMLDKLSDQLQRPSVITTLLAATAAGGLVVYKKFVAPRPTLIELSKQAGTNNEVFISLLKKHGYTKTTVKSADLVNLGLDARRAQQVLSRLEA